MRKIRLTLAPLTITMFMMLAVMACSEDRAPGHHVKTPITLGTLSIEAADPHTRATAEEFFLHEDILTLRAINKSSSMEDFTIHYIFDKPDPAQPGKWECISNPLYLEDVYSNGSITHDFTLSFGDFIANQQGIKAYHWSDTLHSSVTLDISTLSAPVFQAGILQRKGVKVVVNLIKGEGWISDEAFLNSSSTDMAVIQAKSTFVNPYCPIDGLPTYQAILPLDELPDEGDVIFHLTNSITGTIISCRYTLDPGTTISEGKSLVITAALDNISNGSLSAPDITVGHWNWDGNSTSLPGIIRK